MHLQTTTTSHFLTRLQVASPAKMITYGQQADCLSGGIMVSRSSKANVSSVVAPKLAALKTLLGGSSKGGKITTTMAQIARACSRTPVSVSSLGMLDKS
jgi:hypothetical protein